jgi:tetratricopeptide (TPR) repeat protein
VSFLRRTPSYDRARFLARAARASRRGGRRQRRKAISLLREVIAHEPENQELHRKLAALLAADDQTRDAWGSYRKALDDLTRRGFTDQAIGVCREATANLPRVVAAWRALAELELARKRPMDAIRALLEGRAHFRSRALRNSALELLRELRRIDPVHLEGSLDLARLLARGGARPAALAIVEELLAAHPAQAPRLCAARLRIAPNLRHACAWLRALLTPARPRRERAHSGRLARGR